jgi:hypothetical protein
MTALNAGQLVEGYLRQLEIELTDLPVARRLEIVEEIRGHIAEERSGMADETDADVMNLLDRLGDPAEIAAEAGTGEMRPLPVASSRRLDVLDVFALVLTPLVWPVGVAFLWASKAWTSRQKWLGTLLPPGGYAGVFLLMSTFPRIAAAAEAGHDWEVAVGATLFTVSLLALLCPIGVGIYLASRARPGRALNAEHA